MPEDSAGAQPFRRERSHKPASRSMIPLTPRAKSHSRSPPFQGCEGGGTGRPLAAVVVTLMVLEAVAELEMVSEAGFGVHVASEGAPVQVSFTVPLKPFEGVMVSE